MGSKVVRQAKISTQAALNSNQVVEEFALFTPGDTNIMNIMVAQTETLADIAVQLADLTSRIEALETP